MDDYTKKSSENVVSIPHFIHNALSVLIESCKINNHTILE